MPKKYEVYCRQCGTVRLVMLDDVEAYEPQGCWRCGGTDVAVTCVVQEAYG